MTIDEAIHIEKIDSEPCSILCTHTTNRNDCIECRAYHKQLAEWLEELKKRRSEDYGYMADIHQGIGYRKAIDDFVNACKEDILCQTFGLHINGIERIAEQLKAGGENEN